MDLYIHLVATLIWYSYVELNLYTIQEYINRSNMVKITYFFSLCF